MFGKFLLIKKIASVWYKNTRKYHLMKIFLLFYSVATNLRLQKNCEYRDICDQICKNQPSSHQVTRHTFHHQSIATPMN